MKTALQLFALGLSLTACSKTPNDTEARQKASGSWVIRSSRTQVTFDPDGSCSSKFPGVDLVMEGSWRVDRGFFVFTLTNAVGSAPHAALGDVQRFKIISMNDHDMVLQMDGNTNLLKAHKD